MKNTIVNIMAVFSAMLICCLGMMWFVGLCFTALIQLPVVITDFVIAIVMIVVGGVGIIIAEYYETKRTATKHIAN